MHYLKDKKTNNYNYSTTEHKPIEQQKINVKKVNEKVH